MATIDNARVDDADIDRTLRYFTFALAHVRSVARELEHEGVEPQVIDALRAGEHQLAIVRRHLAQQPLQP
jgi:ABC-type cobalamin/Fe3+-siderophores transport system ATPase subunit